MVGKLKEGRGALLESDIGEAIWVESAIFEGTGENYLLTIDIFQLRQLKLRAFPPSNQPKWYQEMTKIYSQAQQRKEQRSTKK